MSLVFHSYVLACHSYIICMWFVCTRKPFLCYSYVLLCHQYLAKKTQNILIFQVLIYEINLIAPRSLKNLQSGPIVIYYVLNNNFFYTQLVFALQKNPYYGFLFWWDFDIPLGLFSPIVCFFFRKIWYLSRASFWSFW